MHISLVYHRFKAKLSTISTLLATEYYFLRAYIYFLGLIKATGLKFGKYIYIFLIYLFYFVTTFTNKYGWDVLFVSFSISFFITKY